MKFPFPTETGYPSPPIEAWTRMGGTTSSNVEVEWVAPVKAGKTRKSFVFRLRGLEPGGKPVVAKLARRPIIELERHVYLRVFDALQLPNVRFHGCIEGPPGLAWIFLDEALGPTYTRRDRRHRAVAAGWLADLHGATRDPRVLDRLPDRGARHHLDLVRRARSRIRDQLDVNSVGHRRVALDEMTDWLDAVESVWPEFERLADELPRVLVHGDFVTKNVRLGASLQAFDWEMSGVGPVGVDLWTAGVGMCDDSAAVYRGRISTASTAFDRPSLAAAAELGEVFRWVTGVYWTTSYFGLDEPYLGQAYERLGSYVARAGEFRFPELAARQR